MQRATLAQTTYIQFIDIHNVNVNSYQEAVMKWYKMPMLLKVVSK